jgi:three-Cys-motif partner protein
VLALKAAHPFTQYFFSDLDPIAVAALKKRVQPFNDNVQIEVAQKDCNLAAAEIATKIKPGTLCLAFLDPTNLALKFSAIAELTKDKAMDLVIHFLVTARPSEVPSC